MLFLNLLLDILMSKEHERSLMYLWISGTDASGHLMGGRSEAMLRSYQIVDAKIGVVMSLVKLLGMEDETLFVITGNHGIKGMNKKLFERIGYRDMVGVYEPIIDSGLEYISGNRGVYLPDASYEEMDALAREVAKDRFVDFTMYKNNDTIRVIGDHGVAEIEVRSWGDKVSDTRYGYRVVEGSDPFAHGDELAHCPFHGFQPEDLNARGPTPVQYPQAIERTLGLFCSSDAPDLIITIGGEASGQHGDLGYEESVVPVVFSGPGIKKMRSTEPVSIVDIAPTMMNVMGLREPEGCDGRALDVLGDEEEYSLPLLPTFYLPLYVPLFRTGVSFLAAFPISFDVARIASIEDIRSFLPDPPERIGTYPAEVFRTFIL
jgi:arylsulfatase A-like enzyme